jgi:hypothetical protein
LSKKFKHEEEDKLMSNSHKKLSLVVLLGALTLGLSSVAKADLKVQWMSGYDKQDCLKTCSKNRVTTYPIPTGIAKNTRKPSFFICTTQKKREAWQPGFNLLGESSCTTAFGDEVYHGEQYYCLCTNNTHPKIFR